MILCRTFSALLSTTLFGLSACGTNTPAQSNDSSLQSVAIPQTDVRDQGRFGICWAYGTTGLIESCSKAMVSPSTFQKKHWLLSTWLRLFAHSLQQ